MDRSFTKYRQYSHACALALALGLVASSGFSEEKLLDRVVAVVNEDPLLHSEVESKIKRGQAVIISEYPAKADDTEYEKALQDAINFELILQKVEELDLNVEDSEVEREIENFLKQRGLSRDGLLEALSQQEMTYDQYKEDFKDQMVIRKFQGRVISPLVKVTDKDIEAFYLKKSGSTSDNVNLTMRQIFVDIPIGSIKSVIDGKNARIKEVHQKLVSGMNFSEAAKLYSDEPSAAQTGGLTPSVRLNELSDEIRATIEPLSVGKFSEPVKLANGFYIFYVENRTFVGNKDFGRQKRHLEFELKAIELQNQTKKWIAEQRRRSKIKIVK